MKTRLGDIVGNIENAMCFHKDKHHIYRFDESALPNVGIYGLKERRSSGSDRSSKVTASKLVTIKSSAVFEKHISDVADVERKRRGRNNRLVQVASYMVELCVVLVKEKRRKSVSAPTSFIVCDTAAATSIGGSSGGKRVERGRKHYLPFRFRLPNFASLSMLQLRQHRSRRAR